MPTASKLFAGICLAVLGYLVSEIIKLNLPASTPVGRFSEVNAGIGFLVGWIVVGTRAGRGQAAAISNGFTGVATLIFWGLAVHATTQMVEDAFDRKYRTMMEAIMGIFEIALDYSKQLLDVKVILVLLCGGIVTGLITEVVSRHWR